MTRQFFLSLVILAIFMGCSRKEASDQKPAAELTTTGDAAGNGGFLKIHLQGKWIRDPFFVAQFTPRGDLFSRDNLQFYNYDIQSQKYPRLLISIDFLESDFKKCEGRIFPMNVFVLTIEKGTPALQAQGTLKISRITDQAVEGQFSGELSSQDGLRKFPVNGEFKGIFRLNV